MNQIEARRKRFEHKLPTVYKRSGFIDWNLNAEIYCFDKRLNENFDLTLLGRAFVQRSYVIQEELRLQKLGLEGEDVNLVDNRDLAEKGREIVAKYVNAFLRYHLPKYHNDGIRAIENFLMSTEKLAYVSLNLGTKELILSKEYPPSEESLATTLLAIVGALEQSQPENDESLTRPYNFVRDFICTQLNQVDINEIWKIDKPFELLQSVCAERNIKSIEPRIIGQLSKADLLFSCQIGIYDEDSKKLLGNGYGDTYDNGIETASIDALSKIFNTYNLKPFDYTIKPEQLFSEANNKKRITN